MSSSPSSFDVISTFSRLCKSGALPTFDLDSDGGLALWAEDTNAALDQLQQNLSVAANARTSKKKKEKVAIQEDGDDTETAAAAAAAEAATDTPIHGENNDVEKSHPKNPDRLLVEFANLLCAHLHLRGLDDDLVTLQDLSTNSVSNAGTANALPRGAAQLLRHGNDVARISMMAQRLAEEVTDLQAAKFRSQQQHATELAQQAASYREVIAGLLEQQAKLERALDEEKAQKLNLLKGGRTSVL